ncbi:MAG: hypothetical protein ACUVTX_00600 [Bacteroidales bacterium]
MKKIFVFSLTVALLFLGCKKLEKEPLGPTDIRVRNLSDVTMNELTVETGGGTFNYGTLAGGQVTEYNRFEKAYPKANISAIINGYKYKTDTVTYYYMQYLGQVKATYEIYIESDAQRKLKISNVIMESPLE